MKTVTKKEDFTYIVYDEELKRKMWYSSESSCDSMDAYSHVYSFI